MTRIDVFLRRLLPTALALLLALAVIRLLWFPGAYFVLAGVGNLVAVMALVSLVIGAGLTTLIYRPGKRGLVLDIAVLAGLELAAFGIAMFAIYQRQPMYVVFAVDRFEVVARSEIEPETVPEPGLRDKPGHAPRLVYAEVPRDPDEYDRLLDAVLFGGEPDIDRRPRYWQRYPAGVQSVRDSARPVTDLIADGGPRAAAMAHWLREQRGDAGDYAYLPLRARTGDAAMILHARVGYPVDIVLVDPW